MYNETNKFISLLICHNLYQVVCESVAVPTQTELTKFILLKFKCQGTLEEAFEH